MVTVLRMWIVGLAVAGLVTACGGGEPDPGGAGAPGGDLEVVATTSILGDLVRNVVGDRGSVDVLIPAGVDPHAFEPSAEDADRLRRADLVIANGLELEASLTDALTAAEGDGVPILHVVEHLDPIAFAGEHGELDPHFWFDPVRTADGVTLIGDRLAGIAPDVADTVTANAEIYREEILALHGRIDGILAQIPRANRKLVTNHDSLGYLAARYGFEVLGTVVPGGTTLADASGRDLAELAETIHEAGVPAIFVETTAPTRLAEAVSGELAEEIEIVELYTGSLGEADSGADTYLGMMETDARRIADGLTT